MPMRPDPKTLEQVNSRGTVTARVRSIAEMAATEPHRLSLSPPATTPKAPSGSPGGSGKPSKYRNRRQVVDGVQWDSRKELARWRLLWARKEAGAVSQLRRQVRFALVVNGVKVCDYVADFVYVEGRGLRSRT
jgi:hypothetical protein